ncbi:NinE family protein [Salmonella enterica subsp. enterica serovar Infantis]|nr:NinE family protein [Salmonella enterica subsp. enterica serovar Infantis]
MARQRRSITDIICENCKYLPTKRSRNKRKPIPKERTRNSLVNWANRHGISLRVPYGILKKHWPEYAEKMTKGGRNGTKER